VRQQQGRSDPMSVKALLAVVLSAVLLAAAGGGQTPDASAQVICEPYPLTNGALSVAVDGLGAFGRELGGPTTDALFDPPGPRGTAGTAYSSGLYLSSADELLIDCADGQGAALVGTPSSTSVSTIDTLGTIRIELTQTLGPVDRGTSALTQTYRLTNLNEVPANVTLVRHLDASLHYDGADNDGAAAAPDGSLLYQYEPGDNPAAPNTLVGITGSLGGDGTPDAWTIQPFDYRPTIRQFNGLGPNDNAAVNPGTDPTQSQQWNVNDLAPNASVVFTTVTRFGTPPNQHTLSVAKTGDGTVTSAPPGIVCGSSCSAVYDEGTAVALAAIPDPGWSFAGWEGACSGVGACVVAMDGARSVVAHFNPPPPTPAQNVNAAPIRGKVLVREPGSDRFVELTAVDQLPVGTQIDTTNGAIQLTAARAGGVTDTSQFFDGLFTITQASPVALTELQLNGGDFSCVAGAFTLQALPKKPVRRLWGSGKGKYRTRGKYSSATVRGTIWKTEDRCDGTLTFVEEGIVGVRDFVRDADVVLRTGQSYLAQPLERGASRAGCTLIGTPGKDTLRGTPRRDVLCGMGGDDILLGRGGNDRLYGGLGNDWLDGGAGHDYLNGGGGHDRLDGNRGRDYLWGGAGRDLLITRDKVRGNDRVQGGSGGDRCRTDAVRVCP
jgi:Divergent InlB B-repeat domain/RTX calcium-binding nonapeptide repeat (4 copies)